MLRKNPGDELTKEVRIESFFGLHSGSRLWFVHKQQVNADAIEVLFDNLEHAVACGLPIFRGVEVLEVNTLFDDVILQLSQFLVSAEWPLLCNAAEGKIARPIF